MPITQKEIDELRKLDANDFQEFEDPIPDVVGKPSVNILQDVADDIYDSIREERQASGEEPGIAKTVGKGIVRGFEGMGSGVGSMFKWAGDVSGIEPLAEGGTWMRKYFEKAQQEGFAAPDPYVFRGTFMERPSFKRAFGIIGEAVPSLSAALVTGGAAAAAARGLGATVNASKLIGAATGAAGLGALEGAPQYEEAREAGKSMAEASLYGAASTAGTALLEFLPISRMMRFAGKPTRALIQFGGEEMAQEATQQLLQNAIAKYGYDDTQELLQGLAEAMIGGFGAGAIAGGTTAALNQWAEKQKEKGLADDEIAQDVDDLGNVIAEQTEAAAEEMQSQPVTDEINAGADTILQAAEAGVGPLDVLREAPVSTTPRGVGAEEMAGEISPMDGAPVSTTPRGEGAEQVLNDLREVMAEAGEISPTEGVEIEDIEEPTAAGAPKAETGAAEGPRMVTPEWVSEVEEAEHYAGPFTHPDDIIAPQPPVNKLNADDYVKPIKDKKKYVQRLKDALDSTRMEIVEDKKKYADILARGDDAISDYDKMMGYGPNFNLNLKRNHIISGQYRAQAYEEKLAELGEKVEPFKAGPTEIAVEPLQEHETAEPEAAGAPTEPTQKPGEDDYITTDEDGTRYRKTPPGQKTVADLVKAGDIVTTSYDTGPYRVESVSGPYGQGQYSLVLSKPDAKRTKKGELPKNYSYSYINELVAQDDRLLKLYEANEDEVFLQKAEGAPGGIDIEEIAEPEAAGASTQVEKETWIEGHKQTADRYDEWWKSITKARSVAKDIGLTAEQADWTSLDSLVAAIDAYDESQVTETDLDAGAPAEAGTESEWKTIPGTGGSIASPFSDGHYIVRKTENGYQLSDEASGRVIGVFDTQDTAIKAAEQEWATFAESQEETSTKAAADQIAEMSMEDIDKLLDEEEAAITKPATTGPRAPTIDTSRVIENPQPGDTVRWDEGGREIEGVVEGIDKNGFIRVKTATATEHKNPDATIFLPPRKSQAGPLTFEQFTADTLAKDKAGINITEEIEVEETGQILKAEKDVAVAIRDIDAEIESYKQLMDCLQ